MGSRKKSVYRIVSPVVVFPGTGGWRFLILPKKDGQKIKETFGKSAKGWGSIRVSVAIGKTVWHTSIFPDKKAGTYLLPLKMAIRKALKIMDHANVRFTLKILP